MEVLLSFWKLIKRIAILTKGAIFKDLLFLRSLRESELGFKRGGFFKPILGEGEFYGGGKEGAVLDFPRRLSWKWGL